MTERDFDENEKRIARSMIEPLRTQAVNGFRARGDEVRALHCALTEEYPVLLAAFYVLNGGYPEGYIGERL